jgi:hypothetical protein
MDEGDSTRDRAPAIAIRLIQERGYDGFIFQDIAKQPGSECPARSRSSAKGRVSTSGSR